MMNTSLAADLPAGLPRHLIASLRAELPSLTDEIIGALRQEFPEYARPMDGPYGQALRTGVQHALGGFLDLLADPSAPSESRDEVFRRLGRYEAYEGRSLDTLQAAFRIGCRLAWQRLAKVGRRGNLSATVVSQLADSVIVYTHELATLSAEGYREARTRSGEARDEWRRRLLALIAEIPPVPRRAITDLAELADWPVPDEVTPVALQAGTAAGPGDAQPAVGRARPGTQSQPPLARCLLSLDNDVLADLASTQPCLLIPGPLTDARRRRLEVALAGRRAAVGLTVPLESAGDSLRWARQALALAESGAIAGGPVTLCEEHLVPLLLLSDRALSDQVIRRQMAWLDGLPPRQRARLTETLTTLLDTGGTAIEAADRLHIHPQTVRYRLRQLGQAAGDQLADPDARFELELALRISRLRQAPTPGADANGSARARSGSQPDGARW
jgi:hypothetical protein